MQLSFVSLCLILAIFSLVVVAIFVVTRNSENRTSTHLLTAFLLATALTLANFLYVSSGLVKTAPAFGFIGNTLGLSAAPLLFLYARSLAHADIKIQPRSLLHFAPVLIFLVLVIAVYSTQPASVKLQILTDPDFPNLINSAFLPVAIFLFVFFYLARTVHLLLRHRTQFRHYYAATGLSNLAWLRISVIGATVVWSTSLLHQLIITAWPIGWVDRTFTSVMASSAFAFGLYFLVQALKHSGEPAHPLPAPGTETEKYGAHRISDEQVGEFGEALEAHFAKTKAYLEPALSLDDLAAALPMTSRELSQTINRRYQISFFELVNDYRIKYAQEQLIADPSLPITEIMTASGFSSKSSFYAAFKKATGQTPTQFRAAKSAGSPTATDNA